MDMSQITKPLMKFLVAVFWPWVKKYVWPIIQKYILDLLREVMQKLIEKIWAAFEKRDQKTADDADANANEAEEKARSTHDVHEREKQEAIAKVWRGIAEKFRQENETLKAKILEMANEAEAELHANVRDLDPDLNMESDSPVLKIGTDQQTLPALPEK